MIKTSPPHRAQSGYVALIAVLMIGAAAVAVSLALLMIGTDSQRSALAMQQSKQARALAVACTEEALQQIHESTAFSGSNNMTLGEGSCTYTVTVTGASTRTIDSSANIKGVVKKIQVHATINISSISITLWQEVS